MDIFEMDGIVYVYRINADGTKKQEDKFSVTDKEKVKKWFAF